MKLATSVWRKLWLSAMLTAYSLAAQAKPYDCAEIYTYDSYLYGKFVARMRVAEGSGVISNFFLWKPGSHLEDVFWQEIDITLFGKFNAQTLETNIISGMHNPASSPREYTPGFLFGDHYHTFTIEWTPAYVRWSINGQAIRTIQGGQVGVLVSPAQIRLNAWVPNNATWAGWWDDGILPVYTDVDWVEYYSWDGDDGFNFQWRDNFSRFDSARWAKSSHPSSFRNQAELSPENAFIDSGNLVLAITHADQPVNGGIYGGGGCLVFVIVAFLYYFSRRIRIGHNA
jgi:beta-glucanase (GH16 family)